MRVGERSLLATIPVEEPLVVGEERIFAVLREKLHLFDEESGRALTGTAA